MKNWKQRAAELRKEAYAFYFLFKHPRTRWYTKCVAAGAAAYSFSPVQLIPNFIPVIGLLDDLVVLFLGTKVICKITPPDLLQECRDLADAAEGRGREEIRSGMAPLAVFLTATSWLLGAVTASVILAAYVHR